MRRPWTLLAIVVVLRGATYGWGADWPMYRGDAARGARAAESLPLPLQPAWTYRARHAPSPAWPRNPRMQFDRAYQPVVAGDRVVFGSSTDGTVTALDTAQGRVCWQFFTDGPVRFAPALWRDRALVASDDGYLYALRLADGDLLWKLRGGPDSSNVLGNGTMISRWPARGGPVVCDDVAYFAAGIWPSEGIFIYALDPASGDVLWKNADSGSIYMPQPHPTAEAKSGVSAQGYLAVSGDRLFVPTGRAVPACFDRRSGALQYFHLQKYGQNGDALAMVVHDVFFNGGLAFDVAHGSSVARLGPGQLAASSEGIVRCVGTAVAEYVWHEEEKPDRKGTPELVRSLVATWTLDHVPAGNVLATAGSQVILGGSDRVAIVDSTARQVVWDAPIDGTAHGLALFDRHLLVSTDRGTIHCFGPAGAPAEAQPPAPEPEAAPPSPPEPSSWATVAEAILQRTGVRAGYCLDLGCGTGELALALAQQSELQIVAVDSDPDCVRQARAMLSAAGLYGARVVVHQRELAATGYPTYFADLIVSQRSLDADLALPVVQEAARLTRPYGGVRCWGRVDRLDIAVRGVLEGAGEWTHQYADAANTVNSGDRLLHGPIGMLWFRDVDFDLPSRHGRGPAPLQSQWRMFHEGLDGVVAVNVYNGCELWRYAIPNILKAYDGDELMGVAGTGSNMCLAGDRLYVAHEHRCLQLDVATGQVTGEFATAPDEGGNSTLWGYLAASDGLLFGSSADPTHTVTYRYLDRGGDMTRQFTESTQLFAIDPQSGRTLWTYRARDSVRHNAIALASGKVLVIDRPQALFDRVKKPDAKDHPLGKLVALDARTGQVLWENADQIYGTLLAASATHGVVLMSYQPTAFRLDSELGDRLAAFRIEDGQRLWDIKAKYGSRPMINDRTIYAQGGAWDLLTGEPIPFEFKRSYGCGILASARQLLVFRSATLGYYDLAGTRTTENYGGIRPGCWINALPVGGLVLLPDATAGCECSYLNKAWIALMPLGE